MQIQGFNYTHLSGDAIQKMIQDFGGFFIVDIFIITLIGIFLYFCVMFVLPYTKIYKEQQILIKQKQVKKSALQKILVQKEIESEIEQEIEEDTKRELAKKYEQQ